MDPKSLPIYDVEIELLAELTKYNRVIVQAPTGSGKSTQVPQILLDRDQLGGGEVVVLQPRRLAARMLARRVSEERYGKLGDEVGYQVRFESAVSAQTRIRYVTEGILLRELLSNPSLHGISAVIFDEFHERHLFGDITLARCLLLQEDQRPDLKIVVMSATLDTDLLQSHMDPVGLVTSDGRTFPVDIQYASRKLDAQKTPIWKAAANAFSQAVEQGAEGDFLIFMPGSFEITKTVEAVKASKASSGFDVLPLHGELPINQQDAAVGYSPNRKVVVSTNVAETSVTIDGVRVVIDSGLARTSRHDTARGFSTLHIEPISKASADQRAGRAGRTAPGVCKRLWTVHEHAKRPNQETPEVLRMDLAEVILTLKASGVSDLTSFQWIEAPDPKILVRAEHFLRELGALDRESRLTSLGKRMLSFPVHPRYARMLLLADDYGCVREACLIAALTQGRSILVRKTGRQVQGQRENTLSDQNVSDFFTLIEAYKYAEDCRFDRHACEKIGVHAGGARQVSKLFKNFLRIADKENLMTRHPVPLDEHVRKCVLAGFPDQICMRRDATSFRCAVVGGRSAELVRDTCVQHAPLLVAGEIREISNSAGKASVLISMVTAVEEEWLEEMFPDDFVAHDRVIYDESSKRVVAETARLFQDLVLERKSSKDVSEDKAAELLAAEVLAGNLPLPKWDKAIDHWITRVNCLSDWQPDWQIPMITDEDRRALLEQICYGCYSRKDLKNAEVWPTVKAWLNEALQSLIDKEVPERYQLPGGRRAKITYKEGAAPELAATIQDLYDLNQTPRIAGGAVPLRISILAPNRRPVQVTEDLESFWKDRYPVVKNELRRRYHKHEWR